MKDPISTLLKASRMARRGRPLSAMLTLQKLILAPSTAPRAKPRKAAPRSKVAKPTPLRPAGVARVVRPAPGSFVDGRFAGPAGDLAYKLYTPLGSARRTLPLVVMLHGCTQSAADFAAATAMNRVADERGFLVLYPEQSRAANMGRCWNWHRPGDQERGRGEPATIAALAYHIIASSRADPSRVYIAGHSAGGAAAAILGAAYPDLFVAVGVHSGLARGTVTSLSQALDAMRKGSADRPADLRRPALAPPMIVFHGDEDRVVNPCNARGFLAELRRAAPQALGERTVQGHSAGGRAFTRTVYRRGGAVVLEGWIVHGSGHGWSGGSPGAPHTDPAGPDASREMARFFLAHRRTAPTKRMSRTSQSQSTA